MTKKFDTAAKSRRVSNGRFFFTAGNTEFTDPVPMSNVWPSGLAFATYSAAIEPVAPGLFSMITVAPTPRPFFGR